MKRRRRDQQHDSWTSGIRRLGGKGATQQGNFQEVVGTRQRPRDSHLDIIFYHKHNHLDTHITSNLVLV